MNTVLDMSKTTGLEINRGAQLIAVRFHTVAGADLAQLVRDFEKSRDEFVCKQPGILGQFFLSNGQGEFIDFVLAQDALSLGKMGEIYTQVEATQAFMAQIDRATLSKTMFSVRTANTVITEGFYGLEMGSFKSAALVEDVARLSQAVTSGYSCKQPGFMGQLLAVKDDGDYCELSFAQSVSRAIQTCDGYMNNEICKQFLEVTEAKSASLEFWTRLA
ncbi:hypothetical protein [Polycladidibacter stylochi]|uniref:hypothetical protein n=1 Tax=Polycladidibacter stylochi TaxID=1807766 RepID=UPI0008344661|nr:hypothetical protein [Pseudovibrio stylochi]